MAMKSRRGVASVRAGKHQAMRAAAEATPVRKRTILPPEVEEQLKHSLNLTGSVAQKWTASVRLRALEFMHHNKQRYDRLSKLRSSRVREVITYLVFVGIFTYVAMSGRDTSTAHYYVAGMKNYFEDMGMPASVSPNGMKNFFSINYPNDFWSWIQTILIPNLRPNGDTSPNGTPTPLLFLGNNMIVGSVIIRQVRVNQQSCRVPQVVQTRSPSCYFAFDPSVEQQSTPVTWMQAYQALYGNKSAIPSYFIWQPSSGDNYANSVSRVSYGTSGFTMVLNMKNLTQAAIDIGIAQSIGWFDLVQTRAVFVEFAVYNPNVNMFMTAHFLNENLPSAGLYQTTTYRIVNLYRFARITSLIDLVVEAVMFLFVLYYVMVEINHIQTRGREYWFEGFNYLSLLNITVFLIVLGLELYTIIASNNFFQSSSLSTINTYQLQSLSYWAYQVYNWNAFNALLTWIRLTKYLDLLSGKTRQLSYTLSRSSGDVFIVLLIFIVIYFGYSLAFYLAFGQDIIDYTYVDSSMIAQFLSLLGVFSFDDLRTSNRILGPILFVSYILVMVFCIMNMFLTVVMKAYDQVAAELEQAPDELPDYIRKMIARRIKEAFRGKPSNKVAPAEQHDSMVFEDVDPAEQYLDDSELEQIYIVEEPRLRILGIKSVEEMKLIVDLDMNGSVSVAELMNFKASVDDEEEAEEQEETHLIMKILERTNQIVQEQRSLLSLLQDNTQSMGLLIGSNKAPSNQMPRNTPQSSLSGLFNSGRSFGAAATSVFSNNQSKSTGARA